MEGKYIFGIVFVSIIVLLAFIGGLILLKEKIHNKRKWKKDDQFAQQIKKRI